MRSRIRGGMIHLTRERSGGAIRRTLMQLITIARYGYLNLAAGRHGESLGVANRGDRFVIKAPRLEILAGEKSRRGERRQYPDDDHRDDQLGQGKTAALYHGLRRQLERKGLN